MFFTAIVGLVGVALGGLIQWLANRQASESRSRFERQGAARELHFGIFQARNTVKDMLENGRWSRGVEELAFLGPGWDEARGVLARSLPDIAWVSSIQAIWEITIVEIGQAAHDSGEDIATDDRIRLAACQVRFESALEHLTPIAISGVVARPLRRPWRAPRAALTWLLFGEPEIQWSLARVDASTDNTAE